MIHPQYADRFIREYILDEEIWRDKQRKVEQNRKYSSKIRKETPI